MSSQVPSVALDVSYCKRFDVMKLLAFAVGAVPVVSAVADPHCPRWLDLAEPTVAPSEAVVPPDDAFCRPVIVVDEDDDDECVISTSSRRLVVDDDDDDEDGANGGWFTDILLALPKCNFCLRLWTSVG